jgi:hypothetical protein
MSRRQASLSAQQKAQIEQQAGKSVDDMTDEELGAEMKKRGILVRCQLRIIRGPRFRVVNPISCF